MVTVASGSAYCTKNLKSDLKALEVELEL